MRLAETVHLTQNDRAGLVRALRRRRMFNHLRGQMFAAVAYACRPSGWPAPQETAIAFLEGDSGASIESRVRFLSGAQCMGCGTVHYGFYAAPICTRCDTEIRKWQRRFGFGGDSAEAYDAATIGWLAAQVRYAAKVVSRGAARANLKTPIRYGRDHVVNFLHRLPELIAEHPRGIRPRHLMLECGLNATQASRLSRDLKRFGLVQFYKRADCNSELILPVDYDLPAVRITPKQERVFVVMRERRNRNDLVQIAPIDLAHLSGMSNVQDKTYALEMKGLLTRVRPAERLKGIKNAWSAPIYRVERYTDYVVADQHDI